MISQPLAAMPVACYSCITSFQMERDDDDIGVFEVTIPISDLLFDNVKVHSMRHHLTLIVARKFT